MSARNPQLAQIKAHPAVIVFGCLFVSILARQKWLLNLAPEIVVLTRAVGGLALFFAMIGLFSLMSYTVTRRTREIGIRMSLGAQRRRVLLSVMRETLSLVGTGALVAVAFAYALSPVLETEFTNLSPHDPGTIGLVIALTFAVGAAAGYLPG